MIRRRRKKPWFATVREGVLLALLLLWIVAVLATERAPLPLTAPLIPYGLTDHPARATASRAPTSPPLINAK